MTALIHLSGIENEIHSYSNVKSLYEDGDLIYIEFSNRENYSISKKHILKIELVV